MERPSVLLSLAVLALLALPATVFAGGGHEFHGKRLSGLDKRFRNELSAGNHFEVALNALAQGKAVNQPIKDLGNQAGPRSRPERAAGPGAG